MKNIGHETPFALSPVGPRFACRNDLWLTGLRASGSLLLRWLSLSG